MGRLLRWALLVVAVAALVTTAIVVTLAYSQASTCTSLRSALQASLPNPHYLYDSDAVISSLPSSTQSTIKSGIALFQKKQSEVRAAGGPDESTYLQDNRDVFVAWEQGVEARTLNENGC